MMPIPRPAIGPRPPPHPLLSGSRPISGPRLLADIGGTNARFALETAPGQLAALRVLACQSHDTLADALRAYLADPAVQAISAGPLRCAGIAIANPVDGDLVAMTNHHWRFSIAALRSEFGFATLLLANDFKAMAMALPTLTDQQKHQVGGGQARADGVIGLLGPGTGLGVSALLPNGDAWNALDSEGGHVSFAPSNERELAVLRYAWREFAHVSAERLVSGIGLELVYRALAEQHGVAAEPLAAPEIVRRALADESTLCDATIDCFCDMLGTVAGNLAITLGARGGIYIGGGIVPRLGERFAQSGFRRRFEQKGRFSDYLAKVPTFVITAPYPGLLGMGALLAQH